METIHFETLGCKLNQIETESLAHAFSEAGFSVEIGRESGAGSETPESGLVYLPVRTISLNIINTCTVTGKAEQKARRLIRLLLKKHPEAPVLVTGCYAEVERETIGAIDPRVCVFPGSRKGELADLPLFLSNQITLHPEAPLLAILSWFCSRAVQTEGTDPLSADTFRLATDNFLFHSRASIKIQDGCNNHCSYCRIRLARGKAVSLAPEEVIRRIIKIENANWAEVILSGVNLSQYRSSDGDFADLLHRILAETAKIAIRVSSLYPERIDETILPLLAHERIRPHFHLSVQSGSDRILSAMRRPYTAETVYRTAERLRTIKENPFLACDIITGFPGETEDDFAQTVKMCTDIGFAWIHAFPFSPRPGTEAWSMKPRIPERTAGERIAVLTALAEKNHTRYSEYWNGRELQGIVEQGPSGAPVTVLTANYLSLRVGSGNSPSGYLSSVPRGTEVRIKCTGNGGAQFVK